MKKKHWTAISLTIILLNLGIGPIAYAIERQYSPEIVNKDNIFSTASDLNNRHESEEKLTDFINEDNTGQIDDESSAVYSKQKNNGNLILNSDTMDNEISTTSNSDSGTKINQEEITTENIDETMSYNTINEVGIIEKGVIENVPWFFNSQGELHIGSGDFSTFNPNGGNTWKYNCPWKLYFNQITKIVIDGPITNSYNINLLFSLLPNLKSIDGLGFIDTSGVVTMQLIFQGNSSLESLDFSQWTIRDNTVMNYMFMGVTNLKQLELGNKFKFISYWDGTTVDLLDITKMKDFNNSQYTGKWQNVGDGTIDSPNGKNIWSSSELIRNYNQNTDADLYVWQPLTSNGDLTVDFIDEFGNKIADSQKFIGKIGSPYTTIAQIIKGYIFKEIKGYASGTYQETKQTVTYIYSKESIIGLPVTVHHQDENGIPISGDEVIPGNIGDSFRTEQKSIPGYTFKKVNGETSGTISNNYQTVTYVYTKDPVIAGEVRIKHVDTENNSISKDIVKTGNIDDEYTSEKKDIKGYTFKEVRGNSSGKFTGNPQIITYIYTKNPITAGEVRVKYSDTENNSISEDIVKTGNIDDEYSSEKKDIKGYTFKEVQGNSSGKFTRSPQTITYIYTKNPITAGEVRIKYSDTENNSISEDIVKTGNIDDEYSSKKKDIKGYTFKEVQGNTSGKFTGKSQVITYVYMKNLSSIEAINSNSPTQTVEGKMVSKNFNSNNIRLPKTGIINSPILTVIGSITLLFGAYVFYFKPKK